MHSKTQMSSSQYEAAMIQSAYSVVDEGCCHRSVPLPHALDEQTDWDWLWYSASTFFAVSKKALGGAANFLHTHYFECGSRVLISTLRWTKHSVEDEAVLASIKSRFSMAAIRLGYKRRHACMCSGSCCCRSFLQHPRGHPFSH